MSKTLTVSHANGTSLSTRWFEASGLQSDIASAKTNHVPVLPQMSLYPERAAHLREDRDMRHGRSAHRVHRHRLHIMWSTKCRHRVPAGDPRLRVRTIRRRLRRGNGVSILHGVLPGDRVRMSVPLEPAICGPVRRTEGRSSHRIQRGLREIRKRGRATSRQPPAPAGSYSLSTPVKSWLRSIALNFCETILCDDAPVAQI